MVSHHAKLKVQSFIKRKAGKSMSKTTDVKQMGDVTISRNGYIEELERQRDELLEVLRAARNLISAKGRHNTEFGYENLRKAIAKIKEPSQ